MIKGIFGDVRRNCVVGWAYSPVSTKHCRIEVFNEGKLFASGMANNKRPDLVKYTKHLQGNCGYEIELPKGRKNWKTLEIYADGIKLKLSKRLLLKIQNTTRKLRLTNPNAYFFIHIPKTAGTSFKKLLLTQFDLKSVFPSEEIIIKNNGLYPQFDKLIKLRKPSSPVELLMGHYPFAANTIFGKTPKKIVILREPIKRVISNIFHMKHNDDRLALLSPEEIYKTGSWNYVNLQTRYLTDSLIHLNMHFLSSENLSLGALKKAKVNLASCDIIAISEYLDKSVLLTNEMFGWNLCPPKNLNRAKGQKRISEELLNKIKEDNELDIKLYDYALKLFEKRCKEFISS